jgi:hypothetical protein
MKSDRAERLLTTLDGISRMSEKEEKKRGEKKLFGEE